MNTIRYYLFIFFILVPFCGCAPMVSQELDNLYHQNYLVPSNFILDDIKLSNFDVPAGYEFSQEKLSYSIQVDIFYEGINTSLYNLPTIIEKDFQTIIGKDERGSIYYFKFDKPLSNSMQERIKRMLYGPEMVPSMEHPEQIYMNTNLMIIWAFKRNSEIMEISQIKLTNYLKSMNLSSN